MNRAILLLPDRRQRVDVVGDVLHRDYVVVVGSSGFVVELGVAGAVVLAAFHTPVRVMRVLSSF